MKRLMKRVIKIASAGAKKTRGEWAAKKNVIIGRKNGQRGG